MAEKETFKDWLRKQGFTDDSINKLSDEGFTKSSELLTLDKADIKALDLKLAQQKLLERVKTPMQREDTASESATESNNSRETSDAEHTARNIYNVTGSIESKARTVVAIGENNGEVHIGDVIQQQAESSRAGTRNSVHIGDVIQQQAESTAKAKSYRAGTRNSDTLELMLDQADQTFVSTKPYRDIERTLEKECHVTICGASGEGKTTMALMLGQKYRAQGYELVFVHRLDAFDLDACISSGQKFCIIFDDFLGSVGQSNDYTYIQTLCNALKVHIDHCLPARPRDKSKVLENGKGLAEIGSINKVDSIKTKKSQTKALRIVFTAKTYDFEEGMSKMLYQRLSMFNEKTVVDLTLDTYSPEEKIAMLKKHSEKHQEINLRFEIRDVINQGSNLFGFPMTCRLFFENPSFTEKGFDFFKRPLFYLRFELNSILDKRNDQAAALILVLLSEENIQLPELELTNTNTKVDELFTNVANYAKYATRSGTVAAARSFRGTFLSRGDNLCFAHSSIYEACACALYRFNPSIVLKYCSLDFLYERLKAQPVEESDISDELLYLFVSKEYYNLLATRLITSMKQGIFSKTVAHPINQNEIFVTYFLEEIKKSASEHKDWIHKEEMKKCFLYWVVRSKSKILLEKIEIVLDINFTQNDVSEALFAAVECDMFDILKHLSEKLEKKLDQSVLNKLFLASAESSNKEIVCYLFEKGAHLSSTDVKRRNILHTLCVHNRSQALHSIMSLSGEKNEYLISAMNAIDENGNTPQLLAAFNGSLDCFKLVQVPSNLTDNYGNTLLHHACHGGNISIVETVITKEHIDSSNQFLCTPIMLAASQARADVFDLLVLNKAKTTQVDHFGNTLLHLACLGGTKTMVERLMIMTPENINKGCNVGSTPIMVAAKYARLEVFDSLWDDADKSLVDHYQATLLHYACVGGSVQIVTKILSTGMSDMMNIRDNFGSAPIAVAAANANQGVFDLLMSRNADTTFVDMNGDKLIHLACSGGSKHIVKRLLVFEKVNIRGAFGQTPIMRAAGNAKLDVFELLLLTHNADTNLCDDCTHSLLRIACFGGNKRIVEHLVTHENINNRSPLEMTPIMVAAHLNRFDIFDLLSSKDADTKVVAVNGNTLLHCACFGGNKSIIERLVTSENINSKGELGLTPIMIAAGIGSSDIFDLLSTKDADRTLVDENGDSLLHHACFGGNLSIVECLQAPENINRRGQLGRTPIMLTAGIASSEIFDLLYSKGADTTLVDLLGDTLLHHTCERGNSSMVDKLVTSENINVSGRFGWTPIVIAARTGKSNIFDLLSKKDADRTLVDEHGDSLLHHACFGGNLSIVECLRAPENINRRGQFGWTPIMLAARFGRSDVFDMLSEYADIKVVARNGDTLLHLACFGGNKCIIKHLVTSENINKRGHSGLTPIMIAARTGRSDIFDLLLPFKPEKELVDEKGNSLLHHACFGGNSCMVDRLVTSENINASGQVGWTPIVIAARTGKSNIFDLLLPYNPDKTLVDEHGDSLLHHACFGGNLSIVKCLQAPENINRRGKLGWTPIMIAARCGRVGMFNFLLSKRAGITYVDTHGDTLFHLACVGGNRHIVKHLMTPENIYSRGQFGRTPIMRAAENIESFVFDLLVSNNADVAVVDEKGNTPLHFACVGGNRHIVERILTSENINSRTKNGKTPLMASACQGHIPIVELLCKKGADLFCLTSNGMNVVAVAEAAGQSIVVKYLKSAMISE